MGDAFPCSPQGLGIEPGGSRPTSNTELFKPVSIVGGIYSSGLTSHPEKIFRENESNDNTLSVENGKVNLKNMIILDQSALQQANIIRIMEQEIHLNP